MLSKGKEAKKVRRNFNIILIGTILIGISLEAFNLCENPSALFHRSARLDFSRKTSVDVIPFNSSTSFSSSK